MAANLGEVDVVVVGLGAAGGVAVLPLTRAGLNVVGLEAGTWMNPGTDYKADEIHNNVRALVTTGNKVAGEVPTVRRSTAETAVQQPRHPMMNAVGGTSIHYHAQSWRLNPWDFKVRSATLDVMARPIFRNTPPWKTGRSVMTIWNPIMITSNTKWGSVAGQGISRDRSIPRVIFLKAPGAAIIPCRLCAPVTSLTTCWRQVGQ